MRKNDEAIKRAEALFAARDQKRAADKIKADHEKFKKDKKVADAVANANKAANNSTNNSRLKKKK